MRVSLNLIKKYIDLPKDITPKQIAYDLTLRTVEVEDVIDTSEKYENIVVGKIIKVDSHPDADKLKVCKVDIGEKEPVQIVCGGSNLYEGENVVVSKPGAKVVWHGEGEPVEIKETKMRGVDSFGMICASEEVFLSEFFPAKSETEITDLGDIDCKPGQSIADLVCMNDTVLEIDNKSLTNRPDLWGHYGIARELSAIYDVPLKELEKIEIDKNIPKYDVEIKEPSKCRRYVGVEIDNVYVKESPIWMKALITNAGMRPINLLVDITNYVMIATGQPLHAFDRTHVDGSKIIVRNAKKDEKLLLLDDNEISLSEDDLVIADSKDAMALAGIRGGKKDSILDDTKGILLEVANFTAETIRKTGKRFDEKTDSSIRYEKNIDTERVDLGLSMALSLIKEFYPESKIIAFGEDYPVKTERAKIDVPKEFLDVRLGKEIDKDTVIKILNRLEYDVEFKDNIYHVVAPIFRSTGDVSLKDDVMGDIARILGYVTFEEQPITISLEHAVRQNSVILDKRLREYLAFKCKFNEVYTYPWIDIKYINAAGIDTKDLVALATPPAPEYKYLRSSLVPGMIDAIVKNTRYFDNFRIFEMAQVFEKGSYSPSIKEEVLPIHKKYLTGAVVGKNAKELFYEVKGIIENISRETHMEDITLEVKEKPSWADKNAYLNIIKDGEIIGNMGLLSYSAISASKIKRVNACIFEINVDKLVPLLSRTNKFEEIPTVAYSEKDLSLIVDENITWENIISIIKSKVKSYEFIEEYRGEPIPEGKKSITLRIKLGNGKDTMTSDEINNQVEKLVKSLNALYGATIREE